VVEEDNIGIEQEEIAHELRPRLQFDDIAFGSVNVAPRHCAPAADRRCHDFTHCPASRGQHSCARRLDIVHAKRRLPKPGRFTMVIQPNTRW